MKTGGLNNSTNEQTISNGDDYEDEDCVAFAAASISKKDMPSSSTGASVRTVAVTCSNMSFNHMYATRARASVAGGGAGRGAALLIQAGGLLLNEHVEERLVRRRVAAVHRGRAAAALVVKARSLRGETPHQGETWALARISKKSMPEPRASSSFTGVRSERTTHRGQQRGRGRGPGRPA